MCFWLIPTTSKKSQKNNARKRGRIMEIQQQKQRFTCILMQRLFCVNVPGLVINLFASAGFTLVFCVESRGCLNMEHACASSHGKGCTTNTMMVLMQKEREKFGVDECVLNARNMHRVSSDSRHRIVCLLFYSQYHFASFIRTNNESEKLLHNNIIIYHFSFLIPHMPFTYSIPAFAARLSDIYHMGMEFINSAPNNTRRRGNHFDRLPTICSSSSSISRVSGKKTVKTSIM